MKKYLLLFITAAQVSVAFGAWGFGHHILFSNSSSTNLHAISSRGRIELYPGAIHQKGDELGRMPGTNYFSKTPIRDADEQLVCILGAGKENGYLKVWVEDANGVHIGPQQVIRDAFDGGTTFGLQLPVPADKLGRKVNVRVKWWLQSIGNPIHDISFEIIDA